MVKSVVDVSQIVNYLDIGLTVAFFVVIGLLVLAFVSGLFKGWRYGTYRFLFFAVLLLVCFCTLKPLASALGSLDLSQWVPSDARIQFDFNVDGNVVAVDSAITSLRETAFNVIAQVLKGLNVSMDPETLSVYATSLVESLLVILLVFIESIVLLILGSLLCLLFWHVLFKRFTPKEKRKKKTLRLLSGIEEFAISIALLAMLITPLTSIANAVSSSFSAADSESDSSLGAKGKEVTPEIYETVKKVVDTYDDSLFSKAFFSWSKNAEGQTFDTALFNYLSAIGTDEKNVVSFVGELSSFTKVATYAVKGGILNEEGVSRASLVTFALSSYMPSALSALAESSLVEVMAPYALAIASNLDAISSYIESETLIDFSKYNYGDTLQELASLYQAVLDSDVLPSFFDESGNLVVTSTNASEAISDHFEVLERLLSSFDKEEMAIFDDILKAALWVQIVNDYEQEGADEEPTLSIKDFFPEFDLDELRNEEGIVKKVPGALRNLTFEKDVMPILKSLHAIVTVDERMLPALFDGVLTGSFSEETIQEILSIVLSNDNLDCIEHYIDGREVEAGEEGDAVLLASPLLQNAVPKLLKMAESMVNGALGLSGEDALNLEEHVQKFKSSSNKERLLTEESQALFDVVRPFAKSEAGKEFLLNYDTMPGLYFSPLDGSFLGAKEELLLPLSEGLRKMDASRLAKAVLPKGLEGILKKSEKQLAGLLGEDFTLHFDESVPLGESFASLLTSFAESQDLISFLIQHSSSLNGVHDAQMFLGELVSFKTKGGGSQLSALLISLADNRIFDDESHSNLQSILSSFLEKAGFGDLRDTIDSIFLESDFNLRENIYGLTSFLRTLVSEKAFERFARFESEGVYAFNGFSFERLFSSLEDVPLVNRLIGPILDDKFSSNPSFSSLFDYGDGKRLSFSSITEWSEEGKSLDALLNFAIKVGDISNLNLLSGDPDSVESLLKALAGSKLFYEDGRYVLPEFLSSQLVDSFVSNPGLGAYFSNFDPETKLPLSDEALASKSSYSDFASDVLSLSSEAQMVEEASSLGDALRALKRIGSFDFLSEDPDFREFNVLFVRDLFDAFGGSVMLRRVPLTHVYYSLFDYLKTVEDSFGYANPTYFYDVTVGNQERLDEAEHVASLLETLVDPSFGALDASSGRIDESRFSDIGNFDPEYFVKPVLRNSFESKVLNTPKGTDGRTAFKELLAKTLSNFSYFKEDGVHNGYDIASYVIYEYLRDADWEREIDAFTTVLSDLKGMGISISNRFDFKPVYEDGFLGALGEVKVANLLEDISSSGILCLGLANKLDSALSSFGRDFDATDLDFTLVNPFYMGKISGFSTLSSSSYSPRECQTLSSLFRYGYALEGKTDFDSFFRDDVDNWTSFLAKMASSLVFNSEKEGRTGTLFQSAMSFTLGNDTLKDYMFLCENPKDARNTQEGNYDSANAKIRFLAANLIPSLHSESDALNADVSSLICDSSSLRAVFYEFVDPEIRNALKASDFVGLADSGKFEAVLSSLNDCPWTRDVVPNAIAIAIKEGNFDLDGIEMKRANPFFQYERSGDFLPKMPQAEITRISGLLKAMNDPNIKALSDVSNFKGSEDLASFRSLLLSLDESEIFHLSGASYALLKDDSIYDTSTDLPVFEQIMYRIYKDSSLASNAFDSVYDGKAFSNYEEKLLSMIKNLDDEKWQSEIDALLINERRDSGLFYNAFELGLIDSSSGLSLSDAALNFKNVSPDDFQTLALSLNGSVVGHEAMRYLTKDFMENTLGLKNYGVVTNTFASSDPSFLESLPFPFKSISFESASPLSVSYYSNGVLKEAKKAEGESNSFVFMDSSFEDMPLGNAISVEGSFAKATVTWSVDDYFLSMERYEVDAIPALKQFLLAIYDSGSSTYLNLSDNDEFVSFLTERGKEGLLSLVDFLKADGGFFATCYTDEFLPGPSTSFEASDAVLSNLLKLEAKFVFHGIPVTAHADLNKYLPNYAADSRTSIGCYRDLHRYLSRGNEELLWMADNFASILYYDAVYTEAVPFAFGGVSLPRLHTMNLLISEYESASVDSIKDYLLNFRSEELDSLEGSFKCTLAYNLYKEVRNYAKAGDYFYAFASNPPSSISDLSLRQEANFEATPFEVDASTYKQFVTDSAKLLEASSFLALSDSASYAVGEQKKEAIESDLHSFVSYESEKTKDVAISYYQGLIYELMVNRSYFHNAIGPLSEVDHILSPFGSDGYFSLAPSAVVA